MSKTYLLTAALLFGCVFGIAQQEAPSGRFRLADLQLQYGLATSPLNRGSLDDFRTLSPESVIANMDFSSYQEQYLGIFSTSSMAQLTMMLGLDLYNAEGKALAGHPQLRLGFNYASQGSIGTSFFRSSTTAIDSLFSPSSGDILVVDSTSNEYVSMEYNANVVQIDASIRWITNPERRFSLYAGAGLNAGMSVNSSTQLSKYHSYNINYRDIGSGGQSYSIYYVNWGSILNQYESKQQKSELTWSVNAPMGVDFKLSQNNEFWRRIHVYTEIRPGLRGRMVPTFGNSISSSMLGALGLKVQFH